MARADLLALSFEDLVALTNRGTVKRAQRELEAHTKCTGTLDETVAGDVTVTWSDGVECRLPGRRCSARGPLLLRPPSACAVILCAPFCSTSNMPRNRRPVSPRCRRRIMGSRNHHRRRPRALFQAARFGERHGSGSRKAYSSSWCAASSRTRAFTCNPVWCASSFRDPRYTHCDCAEATPCSHVPLAVWAFRKLDAAKSAGILATAERPTPVPVDLLDEIETVVHEIPEIGVSGMVSAFTSQLSPISGISWTTVSISSSRSTGTGRRPLGGGENAGALRGVEFANATRPAAHGNTARLRTITVRVTRIAGNEKRTRQDCR